MNTNLILAILGYLILTFLFTYPCIWFLRNKNKKSTNIYQEIIILMEIVFLIIMPAAGLYFYQIVASHHPEFYDWKYYSVVILTSISIACYFISRMAKHKLNSIIKKIVSFLLICGILIAIWMLINFFYVGAVGGYALFSPLIPVIFFTFPYYSLFPVIILFLFQLKSLLTTYKNPETLEINHEK
jgi:hypothetical protein